MYTKRGKIISDGVATYEVISKISTGYVCIDPMQLYGGSQLVEFIGTALVHVPNSMVSVEPQKKGGKNA